MDNRVKITVARCGIACEACILFICKECSGCEMENTQITRCLIFKCAKEKNVNICLQCPEYPCYLMVGLSRAYCPVHSEIKSSKKNQHPYPIKPLAFNHM
jgi:hypothetical protein